MRRLHKFTITLLSAGLLAGCGNAVPDIDSELLNRKHAVLMLTPDQITPEEDKLVQTTLSEWRNEAGIAYDRLTNVKAITEQHRSQIQAKPYDYVIVMGSGLSRQSVQEAVYGSNTRWILLEDVQGAALDLPPAASHIQVRSLPEEKILFEWEEWVVQQLISGRRLEWITASAKPIPSEWIAVDETRSIHYSDTELWLEKLEARVKGSKPDYIVIYSPIDEEALESILSLKVPVVHFGSSSADVKWENVFSSLLQDIQSDQWTSGRKPYGEEEVILD